MDRWAIRFTIYSFVIFACAVPLLYAQAPTQPDIYEHFIGTWVGTDAYMKDGVSHQIAVKIIITETKKKDRLRLDYTYGQKGAPDFDHETRFLKLDPTKSEFDLWWQGNSKETYKAVGLDEFAKSGLGKFTGSTMKPHDAEQDRFLRVIFTLTNVTLSYEWQHGLDEDHLVFLSMFTLSRSTAAGQP